MGVIDMAFAPSYSYPDVSPAYSDFANPLGLLALLSTGLGIGSTIYNPLQSSAEADRFLRQARQPLDPSSYLRAITKAEEAAMQRTIKGDLVTRGVPLDSAYATGLIAELMAKDARGRLADAYGIAAGQQGNVLGAYRSRLEERAQRRPMGDVSALPSYLQAMMMARQRQAIEQRQGTQQTQFMDMLRRLTGGDTSEMGLYNDIDRPTPATANSFQGDVMTPSEEQYGNLDYTAVDY